jgi:exodeoxyribonuclease VIII
MSCYGFINEETIKKYGLGELPDISNEEYHKINALSSSDIKTMTISIDMVIKKMQYKRDESPAMNMGTALHEALLEPEKFRFSSYRFKPTDSHKLKIMIENARLVFGEVLKGCKCETSYLTKDDVFLKKCRPDAYNEDLGIVFDVKTSRYGDVESFYRYDIKGRNYDIQAAWYLDVLNSLNKYAEHFVFLVVQNQSPYNCFAVEVHQSIIEKGRARYSELLEKYESYCKNGQILDIKTVYDYDYLRSLNGE